MMKLYEIDKALTECTDLDTGEILNLERFEKLQIARETKIENIALYIKNLLAGAAAIHEEEKKLAQRRQAKENEAERLKEYLKTALDGEPFETARVRLSFRKSVNTDVTDAAAVIGYLERHEIEDGLKYSPPQIRLEKLKELLLSGAEIRGAALREIGNLQIK